MKELMKDEIVGFLIVLEETAIYVHIMLCRELMENKQKSEFSNI